MPATTVWYRHNVTVARVSHCERAVIWRTHVSDPDAVEMCRYRSARQAQCGSSGSAYPTLLGECRTAVKDVLVYLRETIFRVIDALLF